MGKFKVSGWKSAKLVFGVCLSYGETFEVHISHKTAYDLKVCKDFGSKSFGQVKGHWAKNSCPVHNFLMENPLKFLLHTKIAYDLIISEF